MFKNPRTSVYLPILLAIAVVTGIFLGNRLASTRNDGPQRGNSSGSNKLSSIIELVSAAYVDSVSTDELIEKTIPEFLKNLDPHTSYIPASDLQGVQEEMQGNFGGIGVQFSIHEDTVQVVDVISGGPSYKLGILPGDRIVVVEDSVIAGVGIKNEQVLKLLRGEKGTHVKVGISRKGIKELIDYDITRGDIPIYSVDVHYMVGPKTGYVKVSRFAEKTYDEFMHALGSLSQQGAQKLILDLRGNPGGYLMAVVKMVNEFLNKGDLIVYTEGKAQPRKTYTANNKGSWTGREIIVLIDEFSASASEIFAGAIQDNDLGIVVGRRSFGKGLVQEQIPFRDGSAIRLTVARYYTPSGRSIQKPYDEGNEDYYQDIMKRAMHKEFEVSDSIQFADSLQYKTRAGRTVYGGGGIMPDYFVPADTTGYSDYFSKVVQKALVYHFAFNFTDQNRNRLNQFKTVEEINKYLNSANLMPQFVQYAAQKGIARDEGGLKISGDIIHTQVKAYIARNILGEAGFFPIIQEIDQTLIKAIELAQSEKPLVSLLSVTK